MKLYSWNVNGIRATAKKNLFDVLKNLDADIYCFQETKASVEQVKETLESVSGYFLYANEAEKKGYSGTAILSRKAPLGVQCDMGIEHHDKEGRVITAEYEDFYLVNVYTPNSKNELLRLDYRQEWDNDFRDYIKNLSVKKPVIACGDFNVAHNEIDIARPKANYNINPGYTQTEIDGMSAHLEAGFLDTFRYFYPDKVAYTWWSFRANARANNIGWRLDYFLVSDVLKPVLADAEILQDIHGSDHCPVGLILNK